MHFNTLMIDQVTFCICTYDNYDSCVSLLLDLVHQKNQNFELLIQDNSPADIAKVKSSEVKKITDNLVHFKYLHKEVDGLSGSRNLCLEQVNTKFIHFLDDDVRVDFNFVDNVYKAIKDLNDPVALGSKVLPDWNNLEKPNWFTEEMYPLYSMLDFGHEVKFFRGSNPETSCWWLAGANLCLNTSFCKSIGGFSTSVGRKGGNFSLLGSEETELLIKLSSTNQVLYSPNFPVRHTIKKSRLNKNWLIKRCAWQSVSDILTNDLWQSKLPNQPERLHRAIETLSNKDSVEFSHLLGDIQYLTFKILLGEV